MDRTAGFPGTIYDGQGKSLDPNIPDLLQEQLDGYSRAVLAEAVTAYDAEGTPA